MFKPIVDISFPRKLYDFEVGYVGHIRCIQNDMYFVTWYDDHDEDRVMKMSEGFYNKNNNKHGRHIYYYSNGGKKLDVMYFDGKKHGKEIHYLNDGNINCIKHYDMDIEHGEMIIIDFKNQLERKINIHYGKNHGIQQLYCHGKLIHTLEYVNGIKHGIESRYDLNGKLMARWQWKDNLKNGNYNEYYPSGNLRFVAQYVNDLLTGTLIELDLEGKHITKKIYLSGVEITAVTS